MFERIKDSLSEIDQRNAKRPENVFQRAKKHADSRLRELGVKHGLIEKLDSDIFLHIYKLVPFKIEIDKTYGTKSKYPNTPYPWPLDGYIFQEDCELIEKDSFVLLKEDCVPYVLRFQNELSFAIVRGNDGDNCIFEHCVDFVDKRISRTEFQLRKWDSL